MPTDEMVERKAFRDWCWNSEVGPIGLMSPIEAARAAWMARAALTGAEAAPPSRAEVVGTADAEMFEALAYLLPDAVDECLISREVASSFGRRLTDIATAIRKLKG